MTANPSVETYPKFLPAAVNHLTEATSIQLAKQMRQSLVSVVPGDRPIPTSYVRQGNGQPPLLLLHGFDSSLLEFRRLIPLTAAFRETWALDLLSFGFTDRTHSLPLAPSAIKEHLYSFWQQQVNQPVVLVGASMGGAAAIDFALTHPEAVSGLVLLDSAGLAAGPAMGKWMFPPLDRWATAFLKNPAVRRRISQQAYFNKGLVTRDAEICASLHLACPCWPKALIAFTKSGGYNFSAKKVTQIQQPTLIIWGRQDKILGTKDAAKLQALIPKAQLIWIEECGHVPHLEKPQKVATILQRWDHTSAEIHP